jgi:16S rRNA (cytidine1402-2'-O)-methyltransferase
MVGAATDVTPGGVLVLAGTPIGRVSDAPARLAEELAAADVVAAEDTRRLSRLTSELGVEVRGRVVSYFEGNEAQRTPGLVEALVRGYRLVVAAVEAGVRVTAVPGPSAVLTALAVSGLPVDRFCFEGFLPRKAGERARRLAEVAADPRTLVYFEAPHRTAATLAAMAEAFGPERPGAVCRELTKTYEEVVRGPLSELVAWAQGEVRGEVTLVVAGAPPVDTADLDWAALVEQETAGGLSRTDAVKAVARRHGVPKRTVYDAAHPRPGAPMSDPA